MHSSSFESDREGLRDGGDVLVAIAALVTEGRIPGKMNKSRGFYEGPHCPLNKQSSNNEHSCNPADNLCKEYEYVQSQILSLWRKNIPVCVEVFLVPICSCEHSDTTLLDSESIQGGILLEQWYLSVSHHRSSDMTTAVNLNQLIGAVRSQLYFSQISAWLSSQEESNIKLAPANFRYRLAVPGETYESPKFMAAVSKHNFPATDLGSGLMVNVTLLSLPRMSSVPKLKCSKCEIPEVEKPMVIEQNPIQECRSLFDDRMHTYCTLNGKHRCEEDDLDSGLKKECKYKMKRMCNIKPNCTVTSEPSTSRQPPKLQVDIAKANSHRQKYLKNPEVNKMEKRNFSPNLEQSVKTPKLDLNEINDALKVLSGGGPSECHHQFKNDLSRQLHREQNNDPVTFLLRNRRLQNDETVQNDKNLFVSINCPSGSGVNRKCDDTQCVQKLESATGGCSGSRDTYISNGWSHLSPLSSISTSPVSRGQTRDCCASDSSKCDNPCESSDIIFSSTKEKINIYIDDNNKCDSSVYPTNNNNNNNARYKKLMDISNVTPLSSTNNNVTSAYMGKARQRITFDDFPDTNHCSNIIHDIESGIIDKLEDTINEEQIENDVKANKRHSDKICINLPNIDVPSAIEQAKFKKSLDSAASMVFHSRTGLPLTSSPAPVRRGNRFDFDSSINSVSAIKSALFSTSFTTDDDSESDGSIVSPCSPDSYNLPKRETPPVKYHRKGHSANLLGTFEESVLNGRLEPVSTVQGFTAELGASGSFVPRHLIVPVTVFFYTLGDNDKVSSPYLGHINLGKKGYNVPKTGTVQVTLSNPLGTVVKMFVIMYNLNDMPPNSQTFIRQRTLYMPTNCKDKNLEWGPKWLRYLIHLRFMSSKSGRIYLHSDIRMIIFRKSDMDTATAHGIDMSYELRSFTHMPSNPKYSPRK